jgi:LuxR family maltose regulon positive regulatory protein
VAAALRGLQPSIGTEVAPILNSSTSPPWEAAISLLIDDLSRLSFDATLVLDDYHIISEPLVHETLSFLVRYAPRQLHLVITGRFEPPLSLPRLRATGQVAELTSGDLSFVAEEVASFYRQRHIELIGEEIARLTERTGGWAAGMQMAALSLKKGDDMAEAI